MTAGLENSGGILGVGGAFWGALNPPRIGGLTVAEYAEAVAARERILDEASVRTIGARLSGELGVAWARLREHALKFGVPFVRGNIEATNRIADWDRLILNDAATQDAWRREYPRALVRACGLDADDSPGRAAAAHLAQQPNLLWNAFVPLTRRRPCVTEEVRDQAARVSSSPPQAQSPSMGGASAPPPDLTVFPGESVASLSDFARIECAIQAGDFMGALYRAGLDPVSYARTSDRWAKRLAADPALRAEYAVMLRRHAAPAATTTTERLPPADTLVFPGRKLARVSDFARISRAAQRGEFDLALERAGVDKDSFANMCARFNEKMKEDKVIEEQFKRLLLDPRID